MATGDADNFNGNRDQVRAPTYAEQAAVVDDQLNFIVVRANHSLDVTESARLIVEDGIPDQVADPHGPREARLHALLGRNRRLGVRQREPKQQCPECHSYCARHSITVYRACFLCWDF